MLVTVDVTVDVGGKVVDVVVVEPVGHRLVPWGRVARLPPTTISSGLRLAS